MRFGVRLPNSGPFACRSAIVEVATKAEEFGFDSIWAHDHIPWASDKRTHFSAGSIECVKDEEPNFAESITTLAVAGGMTRSIQLGLAGLVLPLRDPRVLAKQIGTLDELCQGRLIVAIGIGAIQNDFEVMSVPFQKRGRIANEYLAALNAIFAKNPLSTFEGEFVSFKNAEFYPKPAALAVWICGSSDAAYRRVAGFGTGWLPVYLTPSEYASQTEVLHRYLSSKGRSSGEVIHGLELFATVSESRSTAVDIARRTLEDKFKTVDRGLAVSLVGSPSDIIGRVQAYVDAGLQHLELKFICHDLTSMLNMMEMVSQRVAPSFREEG